MEAHKSSVSGKARLEPRTQSISPHHSDSQRCRPALVPWDNVLQGTGSHSPSGALLEAPGHSRSPTAHSGAEAPTNSTGRESSRQTYLDILRVQILKVSQLPILQQSDFIRLTWRSINSIFPISDCFQIGAHPARGLLNILSARPGLMAKEQSREGSPRTAPITLWTGQPHLSGQPLGLGQSK